MSEPLTEDELAVMEAAATRQDVPRLLAEVRRLQAENERLHSEVMLRNVILDDCYQRLPSDGSTLMWAVEALVQGDEQEDATEGEAALEEYRAKVREGMGE